MEVPANAKQDHPELAVGIILEHPVEVDQILLLQSQKWEGQYRVPRGHLALGETLEQAVRRIIRTEIGIDCGDIELISYQESIFSDEFVDPHHFVFLNFHAKSKPFDNLSTNNARWVRTYEIMDRTMNKSTRLLVEAYLDRVRTS